jgi:DNA-binding NtrC family response regulator
VVEDDKSVRKLFIEILTLDHGARTTEAEEVGQAIALIDACSFHAVIADVVLKGGTARDIYDHLRETKNPLQDRILFTSAHLELPGIENLCTQTGNVFLRKPFTLPQFSEALSRILQRSDSPRPGSAPLPENSLLG